MSQEERSANVKFYLVSLSFSMALEKPENSWERSQVEVKDQSVLLPPEI